MAEQRNRAEWVREEGTDTDLTDLTIAYRLLSALHLDVLQNLILGASIPATILRVIGPDVSKLLSPAMGLEPVFQSSGFDAVGIRSKLVDAGIVVEQGELS